LRQKSQHLSRAAAFRPFVEACLFRNHLDVFQWTDPLPSLAAATNVVGRLGRKLWRVLGVRRQPQEEQYGQT